MLLRSIVTLIFLASCDGRQPVTVSCHPEPAYAKAAKSALRLRLFCDGELEGYGSATAISPWIAVTAKHVQCDDKTQESSYEAVTIDGGVVHLIMGAEAEAGVDVMLLESLGGKFDHYAAIADEDPERWEHVFGVTGDGGLDHHGFPPFHLKHGWVGQIDWRKIYVDGHCCPGNSGSAFFNDRGEIVGVLSAGVWDPRRENWCEGYRPASWLRLVSP